MQQQRRCSIRSAISTILIIVAVDIVVGSPNDVQKKADFVFVVERSPLVWKSGRQYKLSRRQEGTIPSLPVFVFETLVASIIRRWVDGLLVCMGKDDRVREINAGYIGFILDITQDRLDEHAPFTYDIRELHESYVDKIYTWQMTNPHPNRLQQTPAIVKTVRDAIKRPDERRVVPAILLWHTLYQEGMAPREAILNLTRTTNGPEAVIAVEEASIGIIGEGTIQTCFECNFLTKFDFKRVHHRDCAFFKPHIDEVLGLLQICETTIAYTKCYYNGQGHCVVDSLYVPKEGTDPRYVKYCLLGIKQAGENCSYGERECKDQCDRIMQEMPCSVTCGEGEAVKIRPLVTDKFTRHCSERVVVVCFGPPCPVLPDTARPFSRRSVATRTTTALTTATPALDGIILMPWMMAVMVVAAVTLLAVLIGVIACCLRKRERSAADGGHWSRGYSRLSAPGRYHSVARSPGRPHGRQPNRYHSRPHAPSSADRQRPQMPNRATHARSRPSHAPSRQTLASNRPAYVSMAPTAQSGQPPRSRY